MGLSHPDDSKSSSGWKCLIINQVRRMRDGIFVRIRPDGPYKLSLPSCAVLSGRQILAGLLGGRSGGEAVAHHVGEGLDAELDEHERLGDEIVAAAEARAGTA